MPLRNPLPVRSRFGYRAPPLPVLPWMGCPPTASRSAAAIVVAFSVGLGCAESQFEDTTAYPQARKRCRQAAWRGGQTLDDSTVDPYLYGDCMREARRAWNQEHAAENDDDGSDAAKAAVGVVVVGAALACAMSKRCRKSLPASAPASAPSACCKVCDRGKACGDSCIAKYLDCHQPPGCACDSAP